MAKFCGSRPMMSKTLRLMLWWNCSLLVRPRQRPIGACRARSRNARGFEPGGLARLANNGPRPQHGDEQDEETNEVVIKTLLRYMGVLGD